MSSCKCEKAGKEEKCWREATQGGLCNICNQTQGCAKLRLDTGAVILISAAPLVAAHVPPVIRIPEE